MTFEFHGSTPDAYELGLLAQAAVRSVTPAELHGALCGVFAAGGSQHDLIELVGEEALTDQDSVAAFWHACLAVAFSHNLDFVPVLDADEDAPVADKVDSLAQWSATFIAGYTRLKETADLTADAKEILTDMTAIAQADTDMDDTEVNEADFVELYEFVRVAGLLLFSEVIDLESDADETIH